MVKRFVLFFYLISIIFLQINSSAYERHYSIEKFPKEIEIILDAKASKRYILIRIFLFA